MVGHASTALLRDKRMLVNSAFELMLLFPRRRDALERPTGIFRGRRKTCSAGCACCRAPTRCARAARRSVEVHLAWQARSNESVSC